jgi:hypothetical protein
LKIDISENLRFFARIFPWHTTADRTAVHRKSDRRRDAGFDQAGPCLIRIAKKDRFLQRFGVRQFKSKALLDNIALLVETLASSRLPASALGWPEIFGLDALHPLVVFAQPSETSQLLHYKGCTQFLRQTLPA